MTSTENLRTLVNKAERDLATLRVRLAQDGVTERTDAIVTSVFATAIEIKKEYNTLIPRERKIK